MRDIASATNMSAGSPFYHFASKQELLFAGVHQGLSVSLVELKSVDADALSPLDYFKTITRKQLGALLAAKQGVAPLVVDEWRHLEGEYRQTVLTLREEFEQIWLLAFKKLKRAGLVARADKRSCWYFLGAMQGVIQWYDMGGRLSSNQIADDLVDWIIQPTNQ